MTFELPESCWDELRELFKERDMTERRSHECGACKGRGRVYGSEGHPASGGHPGCPVCLGSGRIPEPTEAELRRDAMADAAQAVTLWRSHFKGSRYHRTSVFKAQECGTRAESAIVYGGGWCSAAQQAEEAARAAFRSFPALRDAQ